MLFIFSIFSTFKIYLASLLAIDVAEVNNCILFLFHIFQSHPACKGPDFLTATFNIYGHSPLVTHFLKMCNLASTADLMVHMSRTEIESQPPYPFENYYIFYIYIIFIVVCLS